MKQIFENRFVRSIAFVNSVEQTGFLEKVPAGRQLSIDEHDGQNLICYVGRHSITQEVDFVLSFRSDSSEEDLNLIFWDDRIVFDSGQMVFFATDSLTLRASLELTTPLIGFFLISGTKLLILEEAFMRIVDKDGRIHRSESFDLVTGSSFTDTRLILQTESGERTIDLTE